MDRFEAMSMLLTVVDKGSLSAAGRVMRVPVPTLSRKISELEALLGTRLLTRTTRKLTLTDTGAAYVVAARRILDQLEEAEQIASGEFTTPKGELVVTAPILFGRLHVLPVVTDFLAQFPEINVRLVLSDRNVQLVDDHVDIAVRIGRIPDSTMIATRIGQMRTVICASPQFLAGHGVPQAPDGLEHLPCIAFDFATPSPTWQLRGPDGLINVPISPRLMVTTSEAAVEAAIRHVGVTRVLHYQAAAAVRADALRIILDPFEPEPVPVSLLHVSRGHMPLKMRRFLDFAAPRLRQTLAALTAERREAI